MTKGLCLLLIGWALSSAVSGCSMKQDVSAVEAQIGSFPEEMNGAQFEEIYGDAGADLKAATKQEAMTDLLSAVHRKLGTFKSGKLVSWRDSVMTNGHFVQIAYSAQYEGDLAVETFLYRLDNGTPELAGYHISSNALIIK